MEILQIHKLLIIEQLNQLNTQKLFFKFLLENKIPFLPIIEPASKGVISYTYYFFEWDLSDEESRRYLTKNPYNINKCIWNGEAANKLFHDKFYHTTYWVNFDPTVNGKVAFISVLFK